MLDAGKFVAAPGIHDMITALIANEMNVKVVYGSGYWVTASSYGIPDAGLATYTEMLDCMSRLARMSNAPLIADADTGYGGLLNVERTVRGYEAAGVSAIQLEDQVFPKKCSHSMQINCIPTAEMVRKIEVACASREDAQNTLIIARTDARKIESFSQTLARARAYANAGADVLFVESYRSAEEMAQACEEFDLPMMVNMNDGGSSPLFSAEELQQMGFQIAIWPSFLPLAGIHAWRNAITALQETGSSENPDVPLASFADFSDLIGFNKVREFNKRWGDD